MDHEPARPVAPVVDCGASAAGVHGDAVVLEFLSTA